jgi:hypothetical protein
MRILYRVQQVPAKSLERSIPGCPCQRQNVPSPLLCPLKAPNNLRRLRLLALKGDRRLVRPSVLWRDFFCASCHDLDTSCQFAIHTLGEISSAEAPSSRINLNQTHCKIVENTLLFQTAYAPSQTPQSRACAMREGKNHLLRAIYECM